MPEMGAYLASSARSPRGTVLLNGVAVPWEDWSTTNNGYYSADTFKVTLPVSSLPSGLQRADLQNIQSLDVEIRASLDGSSGISLISGRVDDIDDDFVDNTIVISGRDYTADMIETKVVGSIYKNQTSSQVVQAIATSHGLTANVVPTDTKVGHYFEIDHDKLTNASTEWDLLTYLAETEGYDVYVTGKVVNFLPQANTTAAPTLLTYVPASNTQLASGTFSKLTTKRNLTLASDVVVEVYSWNHKQKQAYKVTVKGTKTKNSSKSNGRTQIYAYRKPGLTKEQALQFGQSKLEDVSRHERVLSVTAPADLTTFAPNQVKLQGTQTAADQLYWVDEVERTMSFTGGFEMHMSLKNHSPQSVVSV